MRSLSGTHRLAEAVRWLGVFSPLAVAAGPSYADIACTTIGMLFLVHAVLTRDVSWIRQRWLMLGLALWAYLCLRSLFGEGGEKGFVLALTFVRFLVFAVALKELALADAVWRRRLALAGLVAIGALALDSVFQYATGFDILGRPALGFRLTAFYHHPWVGAMLSWLFLPIALSLADAGRALWAVAFGFLCLAAIVLSGDRMALLTALLAVALLGLLFRGPRRVLLIALPVAGLILAGVLVLNRSVYDRQVASTVQTIEGFAHSHYAMIWESTVRIWRDYPIFGTGRGGYRAICANPEFGPLYPDPSQPALARCATHTHNIYLEWLVESGLVGFSLFLAMLAFIVNDFVAGLRISGRDWVYCGLFVTLLARLWPVASWTSFHHAWSAVPFWLLVGWGLSYMGPRMRDDMP